MSAKEDLIRVLTSQYNTIVNIPYFHRIIDSALFNNSLPDDDALHPRHYIAGPDLPYTTVRTRYLELIRAKLEDNTDYDEILVKMFETVDSSGVYHHTTLLLHKYRMYVNGTDATYGSNSDSDSDDS